MRNEAEVYDPREPGAIGREAGDEVRFCPDRFGVETAGPRLFSIRALEDVTVFNPQQFVVPADV